MLHDPWSWVAGFALGAAVVAAAGAYGMRRYARRAEAGVIEITFRDGKRVRVDANVDAAALARVLDVLERR